MSFRIEDAARRFTASYLSRSLRIDVSDLDHVHRAWPRFERWCLAMAPDNDVDGDQTNAGGYDSKAGGHDSRSRTVACRVRHSEE